MRTCTALILATLFLQTVQSQGQEKYTGLWLGIMKVSEQMSLQMAFEIEGEDECDRTECL